jgi:hypothetical protein
VEKLLSNYEKISRGKKGRSVIKIALLQAHHKFLSRARLMTEAGGQKLLILIS